MKNPALEARRSQCIMALASAAVVVVCVCIGVTMNLTTIYDENFDHMGLRTFCMFTVNSNILAGVAMFLSMSYSIDGLRTGHYHLPNWTVDFVYVGVTSVALTFLVSLFILAPFKGFVLIFTGSRFFLHGVCPVLAVIAFCFFMCDHYISTKESFLTLVPVFIYAVLYFVMVVVLGEERGGWNDFYGFATRVSVWIPCLFILPVTMGIATLLRFLHNKACLARRRRDVSLYRRAYAEKDLRSVVAQMARSRKGERRTADILVPARTIQYLIEDTGSDLSLEEGCRCYLDTFLDYNYESDPDGI